MTVGSETYVKLYVAGKRMTFLQHRGARKVAVVAEKRKLCKTHWTGNLRKSRARVPGGANGAGQASGRKWCAGGSDYTFRDFESNGQSWQLGTDSPHPFDSFQSGIFLTPPGGGVPGGAQPSTIGKLKIDGGWGMEAGRQVSGGGRGGEGGVCGGWD